MDPFPGIPKKKTGYAKYAGFSTHNRGMFTLESFPELRKLSFSLRMALVNSANNNLANQSWSNYKTVSNHLVNAQKYTGVKMKFPLQPPMILAFIGYLMEHRGIKAKSINQYLSGLRMLHLVRGLECPLLRPAIVQAVLKGRENFDEEVARHDFKNKRLPVTLEVMKMINILSGKQNWTQKKEKLVMAVCTILFSGGLRGGELLCTDEYSFDPLNTCLRKDLWIVKKQVQGRWREILCIRLKSSKESRSYCRGQIIEVFDMKGSIFCPVKALKEYWGLCFGADKNAPAFRSDSGMCYRKAQLNKDLKTMLKPWIKYGSISCHSFRSGLASLLASGGISDSEIQQMGRWTSDAFKRYILLPRITRSRMAGKVEQLMV